MKLNMIICTFIIVIGWGCSQETNQVNTTLAVKGMTCGGCVNNVQTVVLAIDGVTEAIVNLKKEEVKVVYDRTKTDDVTLAKKIAAEAGKIAILNNGEEFLPEIGVNDVCSMKIMKIAVNSDMIYACSEETKCTNEAIALHKKKTEDKWKRTIYNGKMIYFCNATCKIVFEKNPEQFFASQ